MTTLEDLVKEGIEAFRLTREYVGEETLPALPGWSWFDWTEKANAALAREPRAECVGEHVWTEPEWRCAVCGRIEAYEREARADEGLREAAQRWVDADDADETRVPTTAPDTEWVKAREALRAALARGEAGR